MKTRNTGFTIIETLIVLAIVGFIMLLIFLAVPSLRNNSHNNARRNDAARLAAHVNDFMIRNNGSQPLLFGTSVGQLDLTGEKWAIVEPPEDSSINTTLVFDPNPSNPNDPNKFNRVIINFGWKCEFGQPGYIGGAGFAIGFVIETLDGNQVSCLQG